jgi:hypothetical protein
MARTGACQRAITTAQILPAPWFSDLPLICLASDDQAMTQKKSPAQPQDERRSGSERRKEQRRDSVRDADKGVLSTRREERRKSERRKEDLEKPNKTD